MLETLKVGVLDSGAGGLTVLSAILKQKQNLEMHYFADDAFSPYGDLSVSDIQKRVINICDFLLDKGVIALVIACNTATLEAIDLIRDLPRVKENNIIVVGVEPAIKPASLLSFQGLVSVLATPVSCKSARLQRLIENNRQFPLVEDDNTIAGYQCIESNVLAHAIDAMPKSIAVVEQELQRIKGIMEALDSRILVLACTHYPLIKSMFDDLFEYPVSIIEPSEAVAQRVHCLMTACHGERLLCKVDRSIQSAFLYTSGTDQSLAGLKGWLKGLLGDEFFESISLNMSTVSR